MVELSSPDAGTAARRAKVPAVIMLLLGALCALISFAATSWYSISGASVIHSRTQVPENSSDILVLVDPEMGSRHSLLVWTALVACILLAVAACLSIAPAWSTFARITALVLAAFLLAGSVARVAVTRLALGDASPVPADVHVVVHFGFWVGLAGLALLGTGAALGPRTAHP